VGYGDALQVSCLEGFDSLGLHQFCCVNVNLQVTELVIALCHRVEGSIP